MTAAALNQARNTDLMNAPNLEPVARRLRDAYSGGAVAPLGDLLEPTVAAVQAINTRFWEAQGRRIVGRKAGLTAKAVQQQLGVDQPDFGVLFDDMRVADSGRLDPARCIQAKAEAEIAFVLGADLPSSVSTPAEVVAAIATVHAAIEIVDSRIADSKITFADTVADNGSSAFFGLADQGLPLAGLDLEGAAMSITENGLVASTGIGAAALGNPLNAAAWLARTLAEAGEPLQEGDMLLAGALGPMVTQNAGDRVRAEVTGIGACPFTFAGA